MTEVALIPRQEPIVQSLTVSQLVQQRDLVLSAMSNLMKENQHYGKIPGCGEKPTLLQPGAQTLAHLFRLRSEYDVQLVELPADHREYRIKCRLFHMGTGMPVSEGVGLCSTMESKFRYRSAEASFKDTGQPLPKTYWDLKNKQPEAAKRQLEEAYGKGAGPRKINGNWNVVIYEQSDEKIEHPNIADTLNTVLKMAKKRAYVDAIITATASSDLFTEDLEDIAEDLKAVNKVSSAANAPSVDQNPNLAQDQPKEGKDAYKPGLIANWHDVIIPNTKNKGKKLGELSPQSLNWYMEKWAIQGKPTPEVQRFDEALNLAAKEIAEKKANQEIDQRVPDLSGNPDIEF
jgi:hypothetical protein